MFYKAEKTLAAINNAMIADQGNLFRYYQGLVLPHIGDAYQQNTDPFRTHMGASVIGNECARAIWYGFHWTTKQEFDGRQLRLFNRGHLEEGRFIAMLLMIGVQVYQQDENGDQFKFSDAGGHFGGSGDGEALYVPDCPDIKVLTEFKTLSTKYSKALDTKGCESEKFTHYVQQNVLMRKQGLAASLYMSVDKNTDALSAEIIPLNTVVADEYIERGNQLVFATDAPDKISTKPGWYKCRFCDHKPVCHGNQAPAVNCRTCMFSAPLQDGTWGCSNPQSQHQGTIDKQVQLTACSKYSRAF